MTETGPPGDHLKVNSAAGTATAAASFSAANGTTQAASAPEVKAVKKRLFICCDGTWNDGINNRGPLTNVSRLARCVEGVAGDYLQIIYYDSGVGNGTALPSQTVDGATGRGISAKIRNAYSFLSLNYNFEQEGDEIFLVGFSRGAFAVQCLASLLGQIGLLKKEGLPYLRGLFTLWANQEFRTWGPSKEEKPLLDALKSRINDPTMDNLVKRVVRVKVLAVWDTVCALGLPTPQLSPRPLSFVGKTVPGVVDNAFQALALNESRRHFRPRVWRSKEVGAKNVRQCWFLGSHADVGGGNRDSGLASLSFLWVIAQLKRHTKASFDEEALLGFLTPVYFRWEQTLNRNLGTYSEKLKVDSHTSTHGQAKKAGWYWWFTGVQLRRKHLKIPIKLPQGENGNDVTEAAFVAEAALELELEDEDATASPPDNAMPAPDTRNSITNTRIPSPDVHFTVRLMVSQKRNKSHVLRHWQTVLLPSGEVVWTRFPLDAEGRGRVEKPRQPFQRQLSEGQWTVYERKILVQWFRREDEIASLRAESDMEDESISRAARKSRTPLHLFLREIIGEEEIEESQDCNNNERLEVAHEKHPAVELMYKHSGVIVSPHLSEMKNAVKKKAHQRRRLSSEGEGTLRAFRARAETDISLFGRIRRRATLVVASKGSASN